MGQTLSIKIMAISRYFVIIAVSLVTANIGYSQIRLQMSAQSNWKAGISDFGCSLTYYHRDHPHDVKVYGLDISLSFAYVIPNDIESRSTVGPFPKRQTIFIATINRALITPKIEEFVILVNGEVFEPARGGEDDGTAEFYFDPDAAEKMQAALLVGGVVSIEYLFADGMKGIKPIGLTYFNASDAMFEACADNV